MPITSDVPPRSTEDDEAMIDSRPASSRRKRGREIRVLIADDDPEFSSALRELIASRPNLRLVGAASDTESAIELCRKRRPDVAILDLRMPGGGGVPAARQVASECPDTRVLALSAYRDSRSVNEMLDAGAVEYLVKGMHTTGEIVAAIARAGERSL